MITFHHGDVTEPDLDGRLAIAHIVSDTGAFGAGVAKAIAQRYPRAKRRYQAWASGPDSDYSNPFRLGAVQWVAVGHDMVGAVAWSDRWVLNMVAQRGLHNRKTNPHPLDLGALRECLEHVADAGEIIAMPRIGCGLGGGSWEEVGPIVEDVLSDVDVHVYDLNPPDPTQVLARR